VRWHGFRREGLPEIVAGWDALLFPSVAKETFGMVAVEAMAVGAVAVSFGIGGSREFTTPWAPGRASDGSGAAATGVVAEAATADAVARALLAVARAPAAEVERLRRAARARVERQFSFQRYVRRHAGLYAALVAEAEAETETETCAGGP
jgi:glycosyltransferase involved in cell wall biosynthesis